MNHHPKLNEFIEAGALFFVSTSGGRDSHAMTLYLKERVPSHLLVYVHADLGEVEHHDTIEHVKATIGSAPLHVVSGNWADGSPKTFFGLVRDRKEKKPEVPSFPSGGARRRTGKVTSAGAANAIASAFPV